MPKLLLHICCGPCSIYPFLKMREEGFETTGFFYNPNIYPEEEFLERKNALYEFTKKENFLVVYLDYNPEEFSSRIGSQISKPERCVKCWEIRLSETAKYAKKNNFNFYSTTLLISPYQNHGKIKEIGEDISRRYGVEFLYKDFRVGFGNSQNTARDLGIYRQKYCGCLYSKLERENVSKRKHNKR